MSNKSIFERVGGIGWKKMDRLLEHTVNSRNIETYLKFLHYWEQYEKTLTHEQKQKLYEEMDKDIFKKPIESTQIRRQAKKLYKQMGEKGNE